MIDGLMNPLEPYGRSLELAKLHPEDLETIYRIRRAGVPVVTVLVSGRPLIVSEELEASDAFVAAWLPGSEGDGVAQMLFGWAQFEGRLPMPWPARLSGNSNSSSYETLFEAGYGLAVDANKLLNIDSVVKAVV